MSLVTNKHARLEKMADLLAAHPEGLSRNDLAQRLGVHRSTILRDLPDLDAIGVPVYEDAGRLFILRDSYEFKVRFTLHEALALHLASRLLAGAIDRANPHGAFALRKLGRALENFAPHISRHMDRSADLMESPALRSDETYLAILETLTRAWAEARLVRLWYQSERRGPSECVFAPYYIEPKSVGRSIYVIGLRHPPGAIRTFKIERLERAELLAETYTIPPDFDPHAILADAWGIWFSQNQAVQVVLRFSPAVARRVRETRWHPSEQVEERPDGSLIWNAWIAEPREMLPWVRGWGPEVEVLEPVHLRETVAGQARDACRLYFEEEAGDE